MTRVNKAAVGILSLVLVSVPLLTCVARLASQEFVALLQDTAIPKVSGKSQENQGIAALVQEVAPTGATDLEVAEAVVLWVDQNLEWTSTKPVDGPAEEILARGSGNCSDLTRVAEALLERAGLVTRRVHEIHISIASKRRQESAEQRIAEHGPSMSVYGERHNDHIWLEVLDRSTDTWIPADPSLGLIGNCKWVEARMGLCEIRPSSKPAAGAMIAPFAVFVVDDAGLPTINRTSHYVIDSPKQIYPIGQAPAWSTWVKLVDALATPARGALHGMANLHHETEAIEMLAEVHQELRSQVVVSQSNSATAQEVLERFVKESKRVKSFSYSIESYGTGDLANRPHIVGSVYVSPADIECGAVFRFDALYLPTKHLPAAHLTLISGTEQTIWLHHDEKRGVLGSASDDMYDEWSYLETHLMVRELMSLWYTWELDSKLELLAELEPEKVSVAGIQCRVLRLSAPDKSWISRLFLADSDGLPRRVEWRPDATEWGNARVQRIAHLRVNEELSPALFKIEIPKGYVVSNAAELPQLTFSGTADGAPAECRFPASENSYATRLRDELSLTNVVADLEDDLARVRAVCRTVHGLWDHHSSQRPERPDALSIVTEARDGGRFRCVEYATVMHASLQAVGIPSRMLNVMRMDIETRERGAGHVVVEAWLPDRERWVYVDAQMGVVPSMDQEPLNAVQFQHVLALRSKGLKTGELNLGDATTDEIYPFWAAETLYYFRTALSPPTLEEGYVSGLPQLLLVPDGAMAPRVFERLFPIRQNRVTRSLDVFYAPPKQREE